MDCRYFCPTTNSYGFYENACIYPDMKCIDGKICDPVKCPLCNLKYDNKKVVHMLSKITCGRTTCGAEPHKSNVTYKKQNVTCKKCLKKINK